MATGLRVQYRVRTTRSTLAKRSIISDSLAVQSMRFPLASTQSYCKEDPRWSAEAVHNPLHAKSRGRDDRLRMLAAGRKLRSIDVSGLSAECRHAISGDDGHGDRRAAAVAATCTYNSRWLSAAILSSPQNTTAESPDCGAPEAGYGAKVHSAA